MNFQHLHPIETDKQLLDVAFRRAREKSRQRNFKIHGLELQKTIEQLKVDVIADVLLSRLQQILDDFPKENELSPFYQELVHITLDYAHYKKSLGAAHWARGKIKDVQGIISSKVRKSHTPVEIKKWSAQFYGRVASLLTQIAPELLYLDHSREIMRTYPDIKEMFTLCLYGFPNVGKTTLLNQLAGTKAKVAAYAFTTTGINAGYTTIKEQKVQVLDVPGTLARPEKMNLIELQAELVREKLASVLIFVVDASETGGYSLKQQLTLWERIHTPNTIVFFSKLDLVSKKQQQLAEESFKGPMVHSVAKLCTMLTDFLPKKEMIEE